jgi:hypothetical protein
MRPAHRVLIGKCVGVAGEDLTLARKQGWAACDRARQVEQLLGCVLVCLCKETARGRRMKSKDWLKNYRRTPLEWRKTSVREMHHATHSHPDVGLRSRIGAILAVAGAR